MTHEASPSQVELIEEIGKVLEGITPEPWEYRLRLLRAAREHMKKCGSCFALTEEIRKREEAEAKLASAQEEIARQSALVEKYAAAARVIGLHLREFCDDSLPYDEMIADASRKVAEELAANRACNRYTWKERAERAEQSLREKDAEIARLTQSRADAISDPPAPAANVNRFACKHCGRDFQHQPHVWSVPGIPARTYFFCSPACRQTWLHPPCHADVLLEIANAE